MQIKSLLMFFIGFISLVGFCFADDGELNADYKVNELKVDNGYLEAWGITKEEYERFLYLKKNTPRGVITPQANPLYYLGIEARNDAERKRYAEKVAQLEFENFEKGRKWREEVQLAGYKLYGKGDLVDMSVGEALESKGEKTLKAFGGSSSDAGVNLYGVEGRARSIFVKEDCTECLAAFKEALTALGDGKISKVSVVFPAKTSDQVIRVWASKAAVPLELNRRGVVDLRQADANENPKKYPTVVDSSI